MSAPGDPLTKHFDMIGLLRDKRNREKLPMKKTWIVLNEMSIKNNGSAESISAESETNYEEDCHGKREREHVSLHYAERRAEELAKKRPGQKYVVCEVISSFVVDVLTKETAAP